MFNSLTGTINHKDENKVLLQSSGLEWELLTTRTSYQQLPEPGEDARLYVHLYHREDQLKLYGFATAAERDVFLDLMKVEGIGARQAQKILSGIEVQRLVEALEREDLALLGSITGIGPKTAQKMLLKLRGRLSILQPSGAGLEEDLAGALIGMGFERRAARIAVAAAMRALRDSTLPREELERELFRKAIALLSSQETGG
jgi:Holliday junction DNA helicase RuvA